MPRRRAVVRFVDRSVAKRVRLGHERSDNEVASPVVLTDYERDWHTFFQRPVGRVIVMVAPLRTPSLEASTVPPRRLIYF